MFAGKLCGFVFVTLLIGYVTAQRDSDYDQVPSGGHHKLPASRPSNTTKISRALGDHCLYDDGCRMQNVFCDQGKHECACKIGFKLNDMGNDCIAAIGALCQSNNECATLDHSECVQGVCVCLDGYVPHPTAAGCLQRVPLKGHCDVSQQCHTPNNHNAHCISGVCECTENFHAAPDFSCIPSKRYNEKCIESYQCFFGPGMEDRTQCIDNVCVCKPEWNITEDNTCGSGATGTRVWSSALNLAIMAFMAKLISV